MDPKHRHEVWEVLARVSRRSAVLVTTQSIEEAEVLADRLIIMRDGRVVCAGSPMWLKAQFHSGYFLRFTKLPNFRFDWIEFLMRGSMQRRCALAVGTLRPLGHIKLN